MPRQVPTTISGRPISARRPTRWVSWGACNHTNQGLAGGWMVAPPESQRSIEGATRAAMTATSIALITPA